AQIKTDKTRLAFARFLARHGKASEAVAQLGDAGDVPVAIRREVVDQLLAKGAFREAFDIWKAARGAEVGNKQPSIYDGGFESPLTFAEGGFGWRVSREQTASISLDASQPH